MSTDAVLNCFFAERRRFSARRCWAASAARWKNEIKKMKIFYLQKVNKKAILIIKNSIFQKIASFSRIVSSNIASKFLQLKNDVAENHKLSLTVFLCQYWLARLAEECFKKIQNSNST